MPLNRRTPWWRQVTLRDVIVFTSPLLALALWFFGAAVLDYHHVRQFDDWWSNATSVRKFAWYRARAALRTPQLTELDRRLSAEVDDKPVLRLSVDRADWDRIDGDVGAHWGEWIPVDVLDGNQISQAELRFRGDGSAHWSSEKKSLTLKTKRGELYKGFRTMAFSIKDVLPQWLVGSLAQEFGLLAPEQQLVPVYLNERFYGLHRFVEPVDESFLRRHTRLPGNIFRADTAERGDYFKGLPREVFTNPYIWDRAANNDRPGAIGTRGLGEFVADVNDSSFEGHERLMSRLDRDELSRLLAFLLIVGDPYHMSGVHNQFWYEDPSSAKLHPVIWDVRLLDLEQPPRGSNINRFWRSVLKDPHVWDGAMREVAQWLEGDKLLHIAEERMNAAAERFEDEIAYDNLRAGVIPPVGDAQSAVATLRKNCETLQGWIADCRVDFASSRIESGDAEVEAFVVDVVSGGRVGAVLQVFMPIVKTPGYSGAVKLSLYADSNRDGAFDTNDRLIASEDVFGDSNPVEPNAVWPGCGGDGAELRSVPVHYRYFLRVKRPKASEPASVNIDAYNRVTGAPVRVGVLAPSTLLANDGVRWLSDFPKRRLRELIELSGEVHLTNALITEEHTRLSVAAGTTLTLAPNVSILIKGKAEFLGTEQAPITIQRANPDLPWGTLALQGPGCNDSRFEHVKFLGGGGGLLENVEYTGMVCVHNCVRVAFDHCEFANNVRCDDSLHVDRGDASVTHCWFHHGNSDAIDYDMSSGLVAYNKIEGSSNDGLDLMTCWPQVFDNDISNSGDKGISVGEDSAPFLFNNKIHGCVRGIESKDKSTPLILNNSITGCGTGVYAHLKNWRYGDAGWPTIVRSLVASNEKDYVIADAARRTLAGAQIGAPAASSSDAPAPDLGDLQWLLRERGVVVEDVLGPAKAWKLTEPIPPLVLAHFEEDFVDPTDGWKRDDGVTWLAKRRSDLVASFESTAGAISLDTRWDLSAPERDYVLVLEVAGEGVANATVHAYADTGSVLAGLEIDPDPSTYRFTSVRLPPGNYRLVEIAVQPSSTRSRLMLHSYRVSAWPRAGDR